MNGDRCFAVLLKNERMEVFECFRAELFEVAERRDAGICGVFEENDDAERFVIRHAALAKRTEAAGKPFVIWRASNM